MKILHICNDFSLTKVHSMLYRELDRMGVEQTIFNPVREANLVGRNFFDGKHTDIIYAHVVKPWHRYAYHLKRNHVFNELIKRINPEEYALCHATTLLTDGGLAYQLYKRFAIPYIVAVRNADINGFLHHMPHTWQSAHQILLHAEKIVFISEAPRQHFMRLLAVRDIIPQIEDRFILQPNGIDNYYLDHIHREPHTGQGIIYIGNFSNNKNIGRLAKAVLKLRKNPQFQDCALTLVGGGQSETEKMERMITTHPESFKFLGPIYEQGKLCEVFSRNRVFAMPSIHETFGLVYIEALSQGLPVLYTHGQGIDGLLPPTAGIAVNPRSVNEIAVALATLLENENNYYNNNDIDFSRFRWNLIAQKYIEIYNGCKKTI